MSSFAFDTAGNIVSQAALEVGLSPPADPYASSDQNFVQLCALMKSLGNDLWRKREWTQLTQVYTFASVANVGRYSLPLDFGSQISQTAWNRTNRLPLGGPLSPQEWEYFKARLVGAVFTVLWRQVNQQIWLYPDTGTPGGYAIAFEYVSRYWAVPASTHATLGPWSNGLSVTTGDYYTNGGNVYVATSTGNSGNGGPTGTGSGISDGAVTWNYVSASGTVAPTAAADLVLFDSQLVMRGLKLAWLKAKGFDTTTAQSDFDMTLEQVIGADSPGRVLTLGGGGRGEPLLGERNVPLTGYGQ